MKFNVNGVLGLLLLGLMGAICYTEKWNVPWLYVTVATVFYAMTVSNVVNSRWFNEQRVRRIVMGAHLSYLLASLVLLFDLNGFWQYSLALIAAHILGGIIAGTFLPIYQGPPGALRPAFINRPIALALILIMMGCFHYIATHGTTWAAMLDSSPYPDAIWSLRGLYMGIAIIVYSSAIFHDKLRAHALKSDIAKRILSAHTSFCCLIGGLFIPSVDSFWEYFGLMLCAYAAGYAVSRMLITEDNSQSTTIE